MTQARPATESSTNEANIAPGTLRADIEQRRARGETYLLREVVAILVPLCTELVERHNKGEKFILTPSTITFEVGKPNRLIKAGEAFAMKHTRDRACVAPEQRASKGEKGGDARSSVFSIGAIMYEMLTGEAVGPGMRRPRDLKPELPEGIEGVLGKALIGDPAHRPGDLAALAQAVHHLSPSASQAPPPADESLLDSGAELEIDVRLSLMPPAAPEKGPKLPKPAAMPRDLMPPPPDQTGGLVEVAPAYEAPPPIDPTTQLADLKARLESDPRPRYVVIKDEMDHGPFTAIELLQQLASHTFESHHYLLDTFSNDERQIKDWEEFAPFAEQSKLNREIKAEKKEIERVVIAEGKATRSKALVIGGVITGVVGVGFLVFLGVKNFVRRDVDLQGQEAISIDTDGGIKGQTKKGPGGGTYTGPGQADPGSGSRPVLKGGMSCEGAMDTYVTELKMSGNKPDMSAGAYGGVLNNGGYVISCGAPMSMTVNICAAIQNGRAVGVTVTTDPPNAGIASCIASRVRGMGFPSHPALDVTRTTFKGQ
ncbi:MAG: hypothetical protein HY898_13470 [Deltaproteobacteria bacterium]|nr:hypothetical protein [Deltaproteobacteria bacterium]